MSNHFIMEANWLMVDEAVWSLILQNRIIKKKEAFFQKLSQKPSSYKNISLSDSVTSHPLEVQSRQLQELNYCLLHRPIYTNWRKLYHYFYCYWYTYVAIVWRFSMETPFSLISSSAWQSHVVAITFMIWIQTFSLTGDNFCGLTC